MVSSPQNPNQNFPDNVLYEMDNLDVLRGMNSETVDLIATDPPFNTKRNRAGSAGFYVDNWKWGDTGKLPDQWAWNEVHPIWLDEIRDENRALFEVIEAASHCHGQDIAAFLCFLSVRLLEMHRVLKSSGSLYLHCDHTANAYIRMTLDAIFGSKNFIAEVIWNYGTPSGGRTAGKKPVKAYDTILAYAKRYSEHTYNTQYLAYSEKYIAERFCFNDQAERRYRTRKRANGKMERQYLDESKGVPLSNCWTDIKQLYAYHLIKRKEEETGSPDQKPLALYERIILASSNPGDLIFDPFAGCATTIMAAKNNKRRWLGIDRRTDARFHVVCRMMGIKAKDAEDIQKLPHLTDWLNSRLAQHEAHFRTTAPVRTDTGETAAPFLEPVYTQNEKSALTHREMKDYLTETFGLQCWGCNFVAPDDRYLQLDHVDPKAAGGSNHLDNRALLCGPCNMTKGDRITINELRRQNTKEDRLTKPPRTKRGDDGHPIKLPRARQTCREALERHRVGQPMQLGMML